MLPERNAVAMTAPMMRAYTELLVQTCHKRGAFAMGGMAALSLAARPRVNRCLAGRSATTRPASRATGSTAPGSRTRTWCRCAREVFDSVLKTSRIPAGRAASRGLDAAQDLQAVGKTRSSTITERGLPNNVSVALQYLAAWLGGNGAVDLQPDGGRSDGRDLAVTQVWQWIHNASSSTTGRW